MPVTTGFDTPGDTRANTPPPRVTVNDTVPSGRQARPSATDALRNSRNKGARFLGEFLALAGLGTGVLAGANVVAPKVYGKVDEALGGILPGGADNPYLTNPVSVLFPNAQGETQTSQPDGTGADNPPGQGSAGQPPSGEPGSRIPPVDPGTSDEQSSQTLPTVGAAQATVGDLRGDLAQILRDAMDPARRQLMIDQDLAATKEINAINQRYAMEKGRENTRRQVIDAWRSVTNEQIKRDAVLGSSMLQAAYLSATPNANVLSALAGPTQQAMTAFKPGSPVN